MAYMDGIHTNEGGIGTPSRRAHASAISVKSKGSGWMASRRGAWCVLHARECTTSELS